MNIERDKFLTEAMGECWHIVNYGRCEKCNKVIHRDRDEIDDYSLNLHFSSWDGFGKLIGFINHNTDMRDFISEYFDNGDGNWPFNWVARKINPDKFANALYEYLMEKSNE
jgi:hypothetical protein